MFRGVSFRGAVRLGLVALSAVAAAVVLAGGVLAAKQWLDTVVFNQRYYASLKASQVDSFASLVERFEDDQLRWAPLLPPCEKPLVLSEQVVAADFASGAFPKEALAALVPSERLGVTVYPVLVVEDPLTRARVVTCGEGELARIPAPPDYDPLWALEALCGDAGRAAAWRESSPWMAALFDSSRIVGRYALLPAEDLSHFVALISATSSRKSMFDGLRAEQTALRSSVEQLTIGGLEQSATGMTLTIDYPDGFTNGLDIFGTDDLIAYWWSLLGTAAVSTATTSIAWTDTDATNVASRYYRIGVAVIDGDEDGYADAREELMYHSDPDDSASFPVIVSGTVTHSNTPQTGPILVVAVKASNSWDTGRSDVLASPGAFAIEGVPNLADYWIRAWRDWCPNGVPDAWEATGTATNCPVWLTNSVSNVVVTLVDPPASISGEAGYTGRQDGAICVVAVTSSDSWATADSDLLTSPGAYHVADLSQTSYWVKAWVDEDADGLFDADREASGAWTNNPIALSNSVWAIDFSLADVDTDSDGMPDWWELANFGDTNQTAAGDYDGDQMPNLWEYAWNFCPTNAADAMGDYDGDGYPNVYEYKHDSNPHKATAGLPGEDDAIPAPTVTVTTNGAYTLQQALAAATGDYAIVLVAAGIYAGSGNRDLAFPSHPVLLIGEEGAAATVIDCQGLDRGLDFGVGVGQHTGVYGLTVRNGAKSEGAGIRCEDGAAPLIASCVITNCSASGDGGGIFCDAAAPSVRDCIVVGNSAADEGGGVRCKGGSAAAFVDCVVSNNTAVDRGGGMHWSSSTGSVSSCAIVGNHAGNDGGGIATEDAPVVFDDALVSSNVADDNGGGVFCEGPAGPVMTGCLVAGNQADDHGGGAYLQEATGTLDASTFRENRGVDGGGIGCISSIVTIVGCTIVDNWAHADGAGVRVKAADATVRNCLIARNRSFGYGGGLTVKGATGRLSVENCTIADNRTRLAGGGVAATEGGTATNVNTILWGNAPDQASSGVASHHSCVQGGASGTGNLTNAPSMTPVLCRLLAGSLCIDSGTNAAWMTTATDIDGEPRVSGAQVDIGADEFRDTDSDGMADAWEVLVFGDLGMDGMSDGDGDGLDDAGEYAWDTDPTDADTDGDGVPDGAEVSAFSSPTAGATDQLLLLFGCGDTLGGSKSERYVMTIENETESFSVTNGFSNLWWASGWFDMGATYAITLVHPTGTAYSAYAAYPPPDYDHEAYIGRWATNLVVTATTNGAHDAWVFSDGFIIRDEARFMGGHWYDGHTTNFIAEGTNATLYVLKTDIDMDVNGDGNWDLADDVAETCTPGGLLGVNWDDDNTNGVPDVQETGTATNENDLVEVRLAFGPTNLAIGTVEMEITEGTNRVNVWTSPTKGSGNLLIGAGASASTNWTVGPGLDIPDLGAFPYTNLWVEGVTNSGSAGDTVLVLRYRGTNGVTCASDLLVLTVLKVESVELVGAPSDGLVVKKGDNVTMKANIEPNTYTPPTAEPKWYYQRLKPDGNWEAWTSYGSSAIGKTYTNTTAMSGVFRVKTVLSVGGAMLCEKVYERMADDPQSELKAGNPDAFGVVDATVQATIRNGARVSLGSTAYAPSVIGCPYGYFPGIAKCNFFVADVCDAAGAPVPKIHPPATFCSQNRPPVANEWGGIDDVDDDPTNGLTTAISGWPLLPASEYPQPGYVVVKTDPSGDYDHAGIVDYDGRWISAGYSTPTVHRFCGFHNYQPARMRKYEP